MRRKLTAIAFVSLTHERLQREFRGYERLAIRTLGFESIKNISELARVAAVTCLRGGFIPYQLAGLSLFVSHDLHEVVACGRFAS